MKKNKLLLVLLWIFNWNHIYSLYIPSNNPKIDSKKTNIINQQGDVSSIKNNNPKNYENITNEQGGPSLTLDLQKDKSKEKKDKKDNFSVLLGGLALIVVGFLIWRFGIRNTITIDTSKNLESSLLNKIEFIIDKQSKIYMIKNKINCIRQLLNNKEINGYLDDICSNDKLHISLPNKTFYDQFHCKELKELYNETQNEYKAQERKDKKFVVMFLEKLKKFNEKYKNIYKISQEINHILLSKDNYNLKFINDVYMDQYTIEIEYNINPIYYINIIFFDSFIKINFKINKAIIYKIVDNKNNTAIDTIVDNALFNLWAENLGVQKTKVSLSMPELSKFCINNDTPINNEIKLMILNFFNIEIKDVAKTDQ